MAKAKESYERWLQDKDSERKRINEEKRLEKEEEEVEIFYYRFNLFFFHLFFVLFRLAELNKKKS